MGQLNLGSTQISNSGSTLVIPSNINLGGNWIDAPSGTIITTAFGTLSSDFVTSNDTQQDSGLATSALVRKLPGGTGAGKSTIMITFEGGCRDSSGSSGQDVTLLYKATNGGSDAEQVYMDAQYSGGYWQGHTGCYFDTNAGSAGDSLVYKAYVRSRGGGSNVWFHRVIGGVSTAAHILAQEIVN